MKTGIIIQARTGSTRLPQKMILPFYKGKGIFEILLIRLKNAVLNVPIILATTENQADQILETIALNHGIKVFRGNENNVLDRFIKAAEANGVDKIIRICADNPFLDIDALRLQLKDFSMKDVDYWCYCKSDFTPTIVTHFGFWSEGVSLKALKLVDENTENKFYQEHVTNYIYTHPDNFKIHFQKIDLEVETHSEIRLTIDTANDFEIAQEIYPTLTTNNLQFDTNSIVKIVINNPNWLNAMKNEISNNLK